MNNLKIIFFNSYGISNKLNELNTLITKNNIDIILISEIQLKPITSLKLINFFTYRSDLPPIQAVPFTVVQPLLYIIALSTNFLS